MNGARLSKCPSRGETAFTMLEIAFSLAIIGFALVAIIGILPAGMSVQKDNREEAVITLDEQVFMQALTSGAQGLDQLTNFLQKVTIDIYECTTNVYTPAGTLDLIPGANHITVVMTATNGSTNVITWASGGSPSYFPLTNGAYIIGVLSTPKYSALYNANGLAGYAVVDVAADFNAMNGPAIDQGSSPGAKDLAFSYHFTAENIRFTSIDQNSYLTNFNIIPRTGPRILYPMQSNNYAMVRSLESTLNQFRLRFSWPVLPGGTFTGPTPVGPGRQTFRSFDTGSIITNASVWFATTALRYPFTNYLYYAQSAVYPNYQTNVLWPAP